MVSEISWQSAWMRSKNDPLLFVTDVLGAIPEPWTGKMVVESKADMKKRGMRSPDLADAFLLTFACGERRKITHHRRPVRRCSAWAS